MNRVLVFVAVLACTVVGVKCGKKRNLGAVDDLADVQLNAAGFMDILQPQTTESGEFTGEEETLDILSNDDFQEVLAKLGMSAESFVGGAFNTKLALKLLKLELLDQLVAKKTAIASAAYPLLTSDKIMFGSIFVPPPGRTISFDFQIPDPVVIVSPIQDGPGVDNIAYEAQITNVTNYGFDVRVFGNCNLTNRPARLQYLAISKGTYFFGSKKLKMQVGVVHADDVTEVKLRPTFRTIPTVLLHRQNHVYTDDVASLPRLISLEKDKFWFGLQDSSSNNLLTSPVDEYKVGYIAIEQGETNLLRLDTLSYHRFVIKTTAENLNNPDQIIDVSVGNFKRAPYFFATPSRSNDDPLLIERWFIDNEVTHPSEEKIRFGLVRLSQNNSCTLDESPFNSHFVSYVALGVAPARQFGTI